VARELTTPIGARDKPRMIVSGIEARPSLIGIAAAIILPVRARSLAFSPERIIKRWVAQFQYYFGTLSWRAIQSAD